MYFAQQQKDLGTVNGYIEEMMDGQKVVKVFCHEEKSLEQFRELNEELRESADKANSYRQHHDAGQCKPRATSAMCSVPWWALCWP